MLQFQMEEIYQHLRARVRVVLVCIWPISAYGTVPPPDEDWDEVYRLDGASDRKAGRGLAFDFHLRRMMGIIHAPDATNTTEYSPPAAVFVPSSKSC